MQAQAFDGGSVAVTSTSVWKQVAFLSLAGEISAAHLHGKVGSGGALAGLKLTRAAKKDGTHLDWLVSTDLNTPDGELVSATINAYTTAANGDFELRLQNLEGVYELGIWALKASADTTVQIDGTLAM